MVGEPGRGQNGVDRLQRLGVFAPEQGGADAARRLGREQEIVFDGVVFEHRGLLEFAPDPKRRNLGFVELGQIMPAVEHHLALVGAGLAGDDVHHRRLAGPIGADDRSHLTWHEDQRQAAQRLIAVERDADPVEIEERLGETRMVAFGERHGSTPSSSAIGDVSVFGSGLARESCSARPSRPLGRNRVVKTNRSPRP
jgi:hypothetical protein